MLGEPASPGWGGGGGTVPMATPATTGGKAGMPSPKPTSFSAGSLPSNITPHFSTARAFSGVMEEPAQREAQRAPGTALCAGPSARDFGSTVSVGICTGAPTPRVLRRGIRKRTDSWGGDGRGGEKLLLPKNIKLP